jgi:hypothetical protein
MNVGGESDPLSDGRLRCPGASVTHCMMASGECFSALSCLDSVLDPGVVRSGLCFAGRGDVGLQALVAPIPTLSLSLNGEGTLDATDLGTVSIFAYFFATFSIPRALRVFSVAFAVWFSPRPPHPLKEIYLLRRPAN